MSYGAPYQRQAYPSQQNLYTQDAAPFDPYSRQPHDTYDQGGYDGGYRDDPPFDPSQISGTTKEEETFAAVPRTGTARSLRAYRYDHRGNLWTKGSRPRCFCRFCGCIILVVIFLLIGILLSLALWIRPPNVTLGDITTPTNGSVFQVLDDGLEINLDVIIGVDNPNYFAVNFRRIKVDLFYPINNTEVGGGEIDNIVFHSHTNANFTFPFQFKYTESSDPNQAIIIDLVTRCLGSPQQKIQVNYKITLGLRVLFIVISPVISNKLSFACPISGQDIQDIIKQLGLGDIAGELGGLINGSGS
ncbi:hypothetical protein DENSPDRAFT_835138 [Dentipellis sp. KUC8613]|nr:hypothetical protein DENSPDRAFT_835138 [Dentipellis sp. KUC8613]